MDLNAYLLNGIVESTTPPGETEAGAQSRLEAIVEMFQAFDPRDAMEAMVACHCVELQFLLRKVMRDANDVRQDIAVLGRARVMANSISKTLHAWVSKFEKIRQRNEKRVAEAREAANANGAAMPAPIPEPPVVRQPVAQPPSGTPDRLGPVALPEKQPERPPVMGSGMAVPSGDAGVVPPPPGGWPPVRTGDRSVAVPS